MLDTQREIADALARVMSDALTIGLTTDDIDEIARMVAAEQPRNLTALAKHTGEDVGSDDLPTYAEAPPGMIDVATAVKVHGVNTRTVHRWINRGLLQPLGKIRGLGGTRYLICEETVAKMAQEPKNKGGRPRKR